MTLRFRGRCWLLVTLLLLLAAPAAAQQRAAQMVAGRLLDEKTREPIPLGAVYVLTTTGQRLSTVFTDSAGRFRIPLANPGEYRLRGERIGYQPGQSQLFKLLAGDTLTFDFWLSTSAVLLAPIEVTASSRDWMERYAPPGLAPFYERKNFYEKLGTGTFVTRAKLADWDGIPLTSLLGSMAGVRTDGRGSILMRGATMRGGQECPPQFYLNGAPLPIEGSIDQLFRPEDLEGVEVYRGAAQVPGELGGSSGACGVIVLWTRRSG